MTHRRLTLLAGWAWGLASITASLGGEPIIALTCAGFGWIDLAHLHRLELEQ